MAKKTSKKPKVQGYTSLFVDTFELREWFQDWYPEYQAELHAQIKKAGKKLSDKEMLKIMNETLVKIDKPLPKKAKKYIDAPPKPYEDDEYEEPHEGYIESEDDSMIFFLEKVLKPIPARFHARLQKDLELQKEFAIGRKIELEHTTYQDVADRIAMHHLMEFDDYYTHLVAMEKAMESKQRMSSVKITRISSSDDFIKPIGIAVKKFKEWLQRKVKRHDLTIADLEYGTYGDWTMEVHFNEFEDETDESEDLMIQIEKELNANPFKYQDMTFYCYGRSYYLRVDIEPYYIEGV